MNKFNTIFIAYLALNLSGTIKSIDKNTEPNSSVEINQQNQLEINQNKSIETQQNLASINQLSENKVNQTNSNNINPTNSVEAKQLNSDNTDQTKIKIKQDNPVNTKKKRISIVWTKGGGCNKSMYEALESYLKDEYEIIKFNPIGEAFKPLDPVYKLTFHKMQGEDFYNFLLSHNVPWLANRLYDFGKSFIKKHQDALEKLLEDTLKKDKPDLMISNLPLLNYEMAEVANKLKIKFLLISPDVYMDNYFTYSSNKFNSKYTIVVDDQLAKESAKTTGLETKNYVAAGFPLRLDFFQKKDPMQICKDFSIPDNVPVVMILMGGTGSDKQLSYIRHLIKLHIKMHIISCAGNNKRVIKKLKNYPLPKNISISVLGYTNRISDLMAISDAIITKPGAATIMEAIEMKLPLIIDHTSTTLKWEKPHLDLVKNNKLGEIVTQYDQLEKILKKLFFDKNYVNNIKKNMEKFSSKKFPENIKNAIKNILNQDEN
jgi:processive 1,2-diacylglycerol beta-glucosyltransferase